MDNNYLFFDETSGEDFIVEARNFDEAKETAEFYFDNPIFDSELDDWQAEMLGYDTYSYDSMYDDM